MNNIVKLGLLKGTIKLGSSSAVLQTPSPVVSEFESFEDLQTALSSTGSINLTGRKFAITQNYASWTEGIALSNDERTITGGSVYGASPLQWTETSPSSGVYSASIPASGLSYDDWGLFLIDPNQSSPPQQHMYPGLTNGWETHPHSYNESWVRIVEGSVDVLGFVTTAAGQNVPNSVIESITITDATTASAWNTIIAGGSQSVPCLGIHSDANLVALVRPDSVSFSGGQLTFTLQAGNTFKFATSGYCDIILGGILDASLLSAGQYAISPTDNLIFYKPADGNPNNALIPTCTKILQLGANTTFSNFSIYGGFEGGDAIGCQLYAPSVASLTLSSCMMKYGNQGIRCNHLSIQDSVMDSYLDLGISATSITADNCAFMESANRPFVFIQTEAPPSANAAGLAASLIENCFFTEEYTTHGQALSLYKDSWQNAIVRNNIFYNCVRAFSAQHTEVGDRWSGDGLEFIFENNLIYWDSDSVSSYSTGQTTVSMILDDTHLELEDHKSYFRHNTVLLDSSLYSVANTENDCSIDTQQLGNSKCICESNITGTIRLIAAGDSWNNQDGQWQYRNAKFGIGGRYNALTGFGETDLSMAQATTLLNYTDNIENGFSVKSGSSWRTAASDSKTIGVRFNPMPTPAALASLVLNPIGWSSTYVPQSIPAFSETLVFTPTASNDRVNEDDDFRPYGLVEATYTGGTSNQTVAHTNLTSPSDALWDGRGTGNSIFFVPSQNRIDMYFLNDTDRDAALAQFSTWTWVDTTLTSSFVATAAIEADSRIKWTGVTVTNNSTFRLEAS